LLEKALADADDKELALPLLCQVCGLQDDRPCLRRCVAELETVDPDALSTAYFATISAALDERWAEAQVAVERAHKAGLPEDEYARLKTEIAKHAPSPLWGLAAWVGSLWLGGLALLFALGLTLSAVTLHLANRGPGTLAGEATDGERLLRRVYGGVLRVCG